MYVFTWVHRWFPAVAVQWNGVDRNHCLWCSPSHSCNCVFPRWFRSPTNSFPTHTPCLPSVRWLIVELKKDTQIGIQHSWLKWKNVCLVLMGKKMQSTGILFLEYSVHFSLNLVLDIVMNAPTTVCTSQGVVRESLLLLHVLQFSTAKRMWGGKQSYGTGVGYMEYQVTGRVHTLAL